MLCYGLKENLKKEKGNNEYSKDYLDSLIWTAHYYFKECINWRWASQYEKTPSLRSLDQFITGIDRLNFEVGFLAQDSIF